MEKRTYSRIPVSMEVKFCCGSRVHDGTVMNISEKGMFISTREMAFPLESQWEVKMPFNGDILSIPVSLRRMVMSPDSHDGIGVEFIGQSEKYYEFVSSLRSAI
ncbi:MAG: PilZ domain-containing protein [Nitrospiraceae bacterium]|nr:MAG: PilZ domain-containing protein [Nitrospiraceae bacterium]